MAKAEQRGEVLVKRRMRKAMHRHVFDRRTKVGRRVVALMAVFRSKLNGDADDPIVAAAVRRAAEVTVLSEELRAKMLRGERVNTETVLRLTRTADMEVRRLGLGKAKAEAEPAGPSLADIESEYEAQT
jgi:hypothetical protein